MFGFVLLSTIVIFLIALGFILQHINKKQNRFDSAIKGICRGSDKDAYEFLKVAKENYSPTTYSNINVKTSNRISMGGGVVHSKNDKIKAGWEILNSNNNITPSVKKDIANQLRMLGIPLNS